MKGTKPITLTRKLRVLVRYCGQDKKVLVFRECIIHLCCRDMNLIPRCCVMQGGADVDDDSTVFRTLAFASLLQILHS